MITFMTRTSAVLAAALLLFSVQARAQEKPLETATPTRPQFVVLTPVLFAVNRADFDNEARIALRRVTQTLAANPDARIQVIGHTDERGSDAYNLVIGRRRAEAVAAYLRAQGVAADRLEVSSAGESQPLRTGHNEEAWAQNRRVEFRVIGDAPLRIPR